MLPFKKDAEYYLRKGVRVTEKFFFNSRGIEQFTKEWVPANGEASAVVCYCHGYGDQCNYFFDATAVELAQAGYAVVGVDYEGHGQSQGLHCYIPKFSVIVEDTREYFQSVRERPEFAGKPGFLYGESMGGAVAINVSRAEQGKWDGMILVAPMCKIADKIRPPWIIQELLRRTAFLVPTLPIVPAEDIADNAFKLPEKRAEGKANPTAFLHKPRLGTAVQLLLVSEDIEKHLDEVTTPFLLMHGAADLVTDPEVSKALYERSSSKDKTFKLYEGMWHALTEGEPSENVAIVMRDIITWLSERSGKKAANLSTTGSEVSDTESAVIDSI